MPTDARLGVDQAAADEVRRAQLDLQSEVGHRLTLGDVLRILTRNWRAWGTDPAAVDHEAATHD